MVEEPGLAPSVVKYFDLMDSEDKIRVAELFTADAVVEDDGHAYRGRGEIVEWLTGPASQYTTTSTWLSAKQTGDVARVAILLEGDFPGGRVELHYEFTQEQRGLISVLSITA